MQKTLGGDRLGSGKKMRVDLKTFNRSTHDLSYLFKSSMASGTLVPFLCQVALPGDTWDINLNCSVLTLPTIGPLFGSYKVQLDLFECPIRLYQGRLHNNLLGVGLKMSEIKLPYLTLTVPPYPGSAPEDIDNTQINPSCLLAYLGIRGIGFNGDGLEHSRDFNAIPFLGYWDVVKNYYANKQEEIGAYLHTTHTPIATTVTDVQVDGNTIPQDTPDVGSPKQLSTNIYIDWSGTGTKPIPSQIMLNTSIGEYTVEQLCFLITDASSSQILGMYDSARFGQWISVYSWRYITIREITPKAPEVTTFDLNQIDEMRNQILAAAVSTSPVSVNALNLQPYATILFQEADGYNNVLGNQEGLALKTYQSDLHNNWIQTEWIDGVNGISAVTAIDTSGGSFTIDTLLLSRKVYDMLNRVAVSGGTYYDWIDVNYQENPFTRCESPIYHGGLSKELEFQAVVSNSSSSGTNGEQPLGTLAGRGTMGQKHKGGSATIKVHEPSYLLGIISLTPRIDYSQGNNWDTSLKTMDDLHKPSLDEIGFQELITEQLAWWDTHWQSGWKTRSAGKQPAWINYMTNVNKTYGNFAIRDNSMFMTLNRRYEFDNAGTQSIKDLTTYIDPSKFNQIFAQTSLDSQNFWAQVAVNITCRRLMSGKIMPNL